MKSSHGLCIGYGKALQGASKVHDRIKNAKATLPALKSPLYKRHCYCSQATVVCYKHLKPKWCANRRSWNWPLRVMFEVCNGLACTWNGLTLSGSKLGQAALVTFKSVSSSPVATTIQPCEGGKSSVRRFCSNTCRRLRNYSVPRPEQG